MRSNLGQNIIDLLRGKSFGHENKLLSKFEIRVAKLKKLGFEFFKTSKRPLIYDLKYNNIKFTNIDSDDVLFAIEEMMMLNPYGFGGCDESMIIVDIGMNIGDSALIKAREENVKKIYAFEPFKQTYERAINNFSANPKLAKKIIPHNFGLSNEDLNFEVDFDYFNPGSQSTFNRTSRNKKNNVEKVQVKNAANILRDILANHPEEKIFIKMDCEGDEYRILNSWDKAGLLKQIDFIAMEWHPCNGEHKVSDLFEPLNKNGFVYFYSQDISTYHQGVLYAIKT